MTHGPVGYADPMLRTRHIPGRGTVLQGPVLLVDAHVTPSSGTVFDTATGRPIYCLSVFPTPPGRTLGEHEALLPLILHERAPWTLRLAFLY